MTLILNGTDNSATTPAVTGGTAGTSTGPYYPTTSQWAVSTAGTQALLINASQQVGIGTASPVAKLAVVGGTSNASSLATAYSLAAFNITPKSTSGYSLQFGSGPSDLPYIQMSAGGAASGDMTIQPYGGKVGIGTTSPSQKFVVSDAGANNILMAENTAASIQLYMQATSSTGALGTLTNHALNFLTNNTERARISTTGGFSVGTTSDPGAGAIYATGNITAYFSDDRLKTKLGNIQDALSKVKALSGFYYEANQTAQDLGYKPVREAGVSAQQVQAVMPEVVKPAPIDAQYLTVDYERLVPLLIEAIKELDAKVEGLMKA